MARKGVQTEIKRHEQLGPEGQEPRHDECRPPYSHYFTTVPGVCVCGKHSIGWQGKISVEERQQFEAV
jgi:hypothetical protein